MAAAAHKNIMMEATTQNWARWAVPGLMLALLTSAADGQQTVELPARDRLLTDRPAELYSIGRAEGQAWEMFSGVRGVAFDASDHLYVLDSQNHRIVVFDPAGRFVREFGRRGGGPGELRTPSQIVVDRDGNLVVTDFGNRAFIVFTPGGEYVSNTPYARELGMLPVGMIPDPRGGILVRPTPLPMQSNDGTSPVYRQHLAAGTPPVRVVAIPVAPPRVKSEERGAGTVTYRMGGETVFAPRISFGVLPDGGVVYQHEAEYAVKIVSMDGRHVRTVTRDIRPRRVTRQDQDAWRERRAARGPSRPMVLSGGSGGGAPPMPASVPSEPEFADVMAVITEVRADVLGRIWVQRRHGDGTDHGPIDLMDAAGRYIGTLPPQTMPAAVSASGLGAYLETDALGVERVAVRRLPASWR